MEKCFKYGGWVPEEEKDDEDEGEGNTRAGSGCGGDGGCCCCAAPCCGGELGWGGGEEIQEDEELDQEEALSRIKLRMGASDAMGATPRTRGRRCIPDAEDSSGLQLAFARLMAPLEVEAMLNPIDAILFLNMNG